MTPVRPCTVCGTPARGGRCAAHPHRRAPRATAAKYRGTGWQKLRRFVLARDSHRCRYCQDRATSVDHVLPDLPLAYLLAVPALAVAACRPCNSSKRDTDLVHWAASSRAPAGARLVLDDLRHLITEAERWLLVKDR